jgi:TPR repeat protein
MKKILLLPLILPLILSFYINAMEESITIQYKEEIYKIGINFLKSKQFPQALAHLKISADLNYPPAQLELGQEYFNLAVIYLKKTEKAKFETQANACFKLFYIYMELAKLYLTKAKKNNLEKANEVLDIIKSCLNKNDLQNINTDNHESLYT